MHSSWFRSTFVIVLKLLQIKEGRPNFRGESIFQKVWIWFPLMCFNFTSFMDRNSPSFIIFQCLLYDSRLPFSDIWNFYKIKSGDLISGVNQFCRKSELFRLPSSISVLKVLRTRILRHSLEFNSFCMIQEYLSQSF